MKRVFEAVSLLLLSLLRVDIVYGAPAAKCSNAKIPDLLTASLAQIRDGLLCRKFTSTELTKAYIARIGEVNHKNAWVNAIIETNPKALNAARESDRRLKTGSSKYIRPLEGVPVVLKDNFNTLPSYGMQTTGGSHVLSGAIVKNESFAVTQLRNAGAIILGKANMDEYANLRGSLPNGFSPRGNQTWNPYGVHDTPSGSSGGSAVSAALGLAAFAMGSDTTGSIFGPSQQQGTWGLRTTPGLISRRGMMPFFSRRDSAGPMTRHAADLAYVLEILSVGDKEDRTFSPPRPPSLQRDYTKAIGKSIKGMRIVTIANGGNRKAMDWETEFFRSFVKQLKALGAQIIDVDMPDALWQKLHEDYQGNNKGDLRDVIEIKKNFEDYLAHLGHVPSGVRTVPQLIKWTASHAKAEYVIDGALTGFTQFEYAAEKWYGTSVHKDLIAWGEEALLQFDQWLTESQIDAIVPWPTCYFYRSATALALPALIVPTNQVLPHDVDAASADLDESAKILIGRGEITAKYRTGCDGRGAPWPTPPPVCLRPGQPWGFPVIGAHFSEMKLLQIATGIEGLGEKVRPMDERKIIKGAKPCSSIQSVRAGKSCKVQ